jgi:hypothetical protein
MAKRCTKCRQRKSLDEFRRGRSRKDGLNPWCKACEKEWCMANAESLKASHRAWNQANPEKKRAHDRRYREKKRGRIRRDIASASERRTDAI